MKFARIALVVLAGCVCLTVSQLHAETHTALQVVNENGVSTWAGSGPFTITGVILNNPEDMLDSTYVENPSGIGAQWQMFLQGIGGDHNGTALWMGQNYECMYQGIGTYDATAWASEMNRLNYNAADNHQFRQGDLITVTANVTKFYGGKRNINEDHDTDPQYDFSISLVTAGYGLPTAEEITLSDLYCNPTSEYPMFDQTRTTGAEYYQGTYVKLTGITLTDDTGWGATDWGDRLCTVEDEFGNEFTLRMPLSDVGAAPAGEFSAYGIINQESGSGQNGRMGYELFVMEVVPEPATLSLLVVGAMTCLTKRRRK